jgi:hypothetical protein
MLHTADCRLGECVHVTAWWCVPVQARTALLKAMEQTLAHADLYRELLADCKDSHVIVQLSNYLLCILQVGSLCAACVTGGNVSDRAHVLGCWDPDLQQWRRQEALRQQGTAEASVDAGKPL